MTSPLGEPVHVGHGLGLTDADTEPDERELPEALCNAIDLLEEVQQINKELDTLVEAGWMAHEYGQDMPTGFVDRLTDIINTYVDAVRRAGVAR